MIEKSIKKMTKNGEYNGMERNDEMNNRRAERNYGYSINTVERLVDSISTRANADKRKKEVCVYWLKNNCRQGNKCSFLHAMIPDKVPICKYY